MANAVTDRQIEEIAPTAAVAAKFAAIVDRERRVAKISQQVLANKIGVSLSTVQRSLSGRRDFTFGELLKVARVLNVAPELLYAEAA